MAIIDIASNSATIDCLDLRSRLAFRPSDFSAYRVETEPLKRQHRYDAALCEFRSFLQDDVEPDGVPPTRAAIKLAEVVLENLYMSTPSDEDGPSAAPTPMGSIEILKRRPDLGRITLMIDRSGSRLVATILAIDLTSQRFEFSEEEVATILSRYPA